MEESVHKVPAPRADISPDNWGLWAVALAGLSLALPTLWGLMAGAGAAYSRGHEPLLLGVSAWLMWRQREVLQALPRQHAGYIGVLLLALTLLAYLFGRTQEFIRVEMLSMWLIGMQLLWWFKGWPGLKQTWFVWLFTLFVLPLPFSWVLTLTEPLKLGVSAVAAFLLQEVGYPVGRQGVVLTVGQYQLLVAEACAGLHSMFVLEAMGLLYSHLAGHSSRLRNGLLAFMAVPVAFAANVLRVMVLVLITYHLGDAVGQGFLHGFAGVVLFAFALVLMAIVDLVLGRLLPDPPVVAAMDGAGGQAHG
jgi:exosortase B